MWAQYITRQQPDLNLINIYTYINFLTEILATERCQRPHYWLCPLYALYNTTIYKMVILLGSMGEVPHNYTVLRYHSHLYQICYLLHTIYYYSFQIIISLLQFFESHYNYYYSLSYYYYYISRYFLQKSVFILVCKMSYNKLQRIICLLWSNYRTVKYLNLSLFLYSHFFGVKIATYLCNLPSLKRGIYVTMIFQEDFMNKGLIFDQLTVRPFWSHSTFYTQGLTEIGHIITLG